MLTASRGGLHLALFSDPTATMGRVTAVGAELCLHENGSLAFNAHNCCRDRAEPAVSVHLGVNQPPKLTVSCELVANRKMAD